MEVLSCRPVEVYALKLNTESQFSTFWHDSIGVKTVLPVEQHGVVCAVLCTINCICLILCIIGKETLSVAVGIEVSTLHVCCTTFVVETNITSNLVSTWLYSDGLAIELLIRKRAALSHPILNEWVGHVGTVIACISFSGPDRKSTRLNSSHQIISYAVFCLK